MGEPTPPPGGGTGPARPERWAAAPVVPWGLLLMVCGALVVACSGLLAIHAAMRWRTFAALPPHAPMFAVEKSALADLVPTLADVVAPASWVGLAVSILWCRARQRGSLGPRRPIPRDVSWFVIGTWLLYLVSRQISLSLAHPAVITNATNASAWACSAMSWTTLGVSWAVATYLVPGYDQVAVPPR